MSPIVRQMVMRRSILTPALLLLLVACQVQTAVDRVAPAPTGPVSVSVQPCRDRTGFRDRDLGAELNDALIKKLGESKEFVVSDAARYSLGCEVTAFSEGSAFVRWLVPGQGTTMGKIAVILTDKQTSTTAFIAHGEAKVQSGGLYTIGASGYILGTAVDEVMKQLRAWARGGGDARADTSAARRAG